MALTIAKSFDDFGAKLEATAIQKTMIVSRREMTEKYLMESFGSSSNLPLKKTRVIGSADRGTLIRPLDDIDVFAEFSNKDNIFDTYRYDSQAFLYRIRDALNAYEVKIVGARGQAVRLFYQQAPHVDIAPVFEWLGGGFALPNGTGGWITTDPDNHAAHMDKTNKEFNYNLKPLVRILKRWNNEHSKYLKSFHLEILVSNSFSQLGSNYRRACEVFFGYAKDHLTALDPAGHSGDLSSYLTQTNRQNVRTNLESARDRAVRANAAEAAGDHEGAIRLWRIVFGDEFPAFG